MKNIRWQDLVPGGLIIFMFGMAAAVAWGWQAAYGTAYIFICPVIALLGELAYFLFPRKLQPSAASRDVARIAFAAFATGFQFLMLWIIWAVPVPGQIQHFHFFWWIRCIDIAMGIFLITVGAVAGKLSVSSSLKGKPSTIFNWLHPSWENASSFARGRSHRLQGWLMISTGLLTLIVCLINAPVAFVIGMGGALATPLIAWSYSYYTWRKTPA